MELDFEYSQNGVLREEYDICDKHLHHMILLDDTDDVVTFRLQFDNCIAYSL